MLVHTGGRVFRESTLPAITDWLKTGGTLIANGAPLWEDLDGHRAIAAGWLLNEENETKPDIHSYQIGRGKIYAIAANGGAEYARKVNSVLTLIAQAQPANAPLNGFNGKGDQKQVTDVPSGRLVLDPKTLATEVIARTKPI